MLGNSNSRFYKVLKGRAQIDLEEIQTTEFESKIRNAFFDQISLLTSVFLTNGKFISFNFKNEIESISQFENIADIFYDE